MNSHRQGYLLKATLNQKPGDHPNFRKNALSEKAILRALGQFWAVLGAALGLPKLILGMQTFILGMASHDLSNVSEQLPERFSELMGTHMKDFHLPLHSRSVFSRIGLVPARKIKRFLGWSLKIFHRKF